MNGGTIANNTATKYGGGVYCEASKRYGSEDTAKINLNGGHYYRATPPGSPAAVCTSVV